MKKIRISAIVVLLVMILSLTAFAIDLPQPTNSFFVNDFANVINSDDENELLNIGADLYNQTTAQVVLVTVNSLDGYDVSEYALELGREWGVGSENADNGVVLLLSVSDRQVTIQVGYGLEGCLTDAKTGRILDSYAIPYLSDNDYSTGLSEAYKAILSVVCEEYGIELVEGYQIDDSYEYEEDSSVTSVLGTILLILFLIAIFGKGGRGNLFKTIFIGRMFGSHFDDDTDFGGGSFGGGFRGGGGSFGGGFRGGGGSFGGGGSSRGF